MTAGVFFDYPRAERTGIPEAVYCEGKPVEALCRLMERFSEDAAPPVFFTRLAPDVFERLPQSVAQKFNYCALSRTGFFKRHEAARKGSAAVVSAGTSDAPVALEALRTLEFMNQPHEFFEDCGVAGLWRLQSKLSDINRHQIIIAVAGMEGALAGILAGLSPLAVIGVPTSVGYGVSKGGRAALSGMLASCAPGVCAVNIDNGFGAASLACKILASGNQNA